MPMPPHVLESQLDDGRVKQPRGFAVDPNGEAFVAPRPSVLCPALNVSATQTAAAMAANTGAQGAGARRVGKVPAAARKSGAAV